jgi:hypothetical protein
MAHIADLLASVAFAPAQIHGALAVHPLVAATPAPAAPPPYLVLDQALASGHFRVTEVSEAGSVPHLRAVNGLDAPVFLLDGEELVGAKQNRVLNLSVLLAPHSETEIPVSCVEMGRWARESETFRPAPRAHFAEGRARRVASVSRSLRRDGAARSDQGEVWDVIAAKSARMAVHSQTAAMADIFERRRGSVEETLADLPTVGAQVGAVYAIAGRAAGIDLFDRPATWARLAPKVHASYALDALEHDGTADGDPGPAAAFLAALRAGAEERFAAVGLGTTVRLEGPALDGAALEVDGAWLHLAAFPRHADAGRGHEPPGRAARLARHRDRVRR